MREEILNQLSALSEEEQYILVEEDPSRHHAFYAKPGRFLIERRRMSHLFLGESTAAICMRPHPRFREFPVHSHDFIEIMYVCSGRITHVFGDREVTLEVGDLLLLGKDTRHAIRYTGQQDIGINLIISVDLFESLLHSLRKTSQLPVGKMERLLEKDGLPFCVFHGGESLAVRNLMESMIHTVLCEKKIDGYILQQSLNLLICYLASLPEAMDSPVSDRYEERMKKQLLNYIRTSYSTATLTEAAQMVGLSAPYLSRRIRSDFGMSFKELLLAERFEIAKELLANTSLPIGDVIRQVGYENTGYFHKEFKKRFGMTPKAYRKIQ